MTAWRDLTLDRDGWCCQASKHGLTDDCSGRLEAHHMLPRGRGGKNDLDNLVTLCAHHHRHVESHRTEAYGLGLLTRTAPRMWQQCASIDCRETCEFPHPMEQVTSLQAAGWSFERQPYDTTRCWYCPTHQQGIAA